MLFYFEWRIQEFRKLNKIPEFTLNDLVNYKHVLKVISLKTEKYSLRFEHSFATFADEFKSPAVLEIYEIVEDIKFYLDYSKTYRINDLTSMMSEILEMEKKEYGNYAERIYYFKEDDVKDEVIFPNDKKQ